MAEEVPRGSRSIRRWRECRGIRFRLKPTGAAVLIAVPLILLVDGLGSFSAPVLIIALGLAGLSLLSFLFLLVQLPSAFRKTRMPAGRSDSDRDPSDAGIAGSGTLPPAMGVAEPVLLEADPPRPGFHPGVKFSSCWRLEFGPFRRVLRIPLSRVGLSAGDVCLDRRGLWTGCRFLELADPFGLFSWEVYDGRRYRTAVPPESRELAGEGETGRPAYDTASAPRPKEDAEELLERRDYRPGDDTRRLDWKQLARTGDMLVRIGDDTVPLRGRIWIEVSAVPSGKAPSKREIRQLDRLLEAADSLVRRLRESGQEALVRLPGEDGWNPADDETWPLRLAGSLPSSTDTGFPPAGERLWHVCRPGRTGGLARAVAAKVAGLALTVAFPAAEEPKAILTAGYLFLGGPGKDRKHLESLRYRKTLSMAVENALKEDLDVRLL